MDAVTRPLKKSVEICMTRVYLRSILLAKKCKSRAKSPLRPALITAILALIFFAGCSRLPSAPKLPSVSPKRAAAKAMSLYDANEDGKIDRSEISKSFALMWASYWMNQDKDRSLSEVEIADRIRSWQNSGTHMMPVSFTVSLDGEPLAGVTVTLEPAEFLGSAYPRVEAVTNYKGKAYFKGPDPKFPGVFVGCYNVLVSKVVDGEETLSERYTSRPVMGFEVCQENWFAWSPRINMTSEKNDSQSFISIQ